MHPYTKHRQPEGNPPSSLYINALAVAATYAASSTPGDMPTAMMEKQRVTAIIPDVVGATIATRTEARALSCQALRPLAGTSSTPRSL